MSILAQDTIVISPSTVNKIESEIEELRGATDCADVVANKAALDAYDTSKLTDQSIVKVLQDESQNDAQTYYRYSKSSDSFTLIGELGPYYTKSEDDALLAKKLDKTDIASQVYGTDAQANDVFGEEDPKNNVSVVNNKIANITFDSALDISSNNAIQNSAVTTAINNKSGVVFRTWNNN